MQGTPLKHNQQRIRFCRTWFHCSQDSFDPKGTPPGKNHAKKMERVGKDTKNIIDLTVLSLSFGDDETFLSDHSSLLEPRSRAIFSAIQVKMYTGLDGDKPERYELNPRKLLTEKLTQDVFDMISITVEQMNTCMKVLGDNFPRCYKHQDSGRHDLRNIRLTARTATAIPGVGSLGGNVIQPTGHTDCEVSVLPISILLTETRHQDIHGTTALRNKEMDDNGSSLFG